MGSKYGLQLYSIREKCVEDLENVLKNVSKAGYDGVEFYSFYDIEASHMKQLLNRYDLKAMGTHTNLESITTGLDGLMKYCDAISAKYVALAHYKSDNFDDWLRLCEMLEKSGERLRRNGFTLMYHNHDHEFQPSFNGEMPVDIILKNTSTANVSLELDCYWVRYADENPETYLKANLDRIKILHIKDMDQDKKMTEVGTGIIDYQKLYNIADKAGFEWHIVEQDNIYIDPFESIKISANNLQKFSK